MNEDDETRFTLRDEGDAPESFYMADAENLRIEKLSTRITLVAVLIPCLLAIIVAVAYLDIKNRVVNTQNTGSIDVRNLSNDLESRFSSLSLRQAKLEEQLSKSTKALQTTTAALQVKLNKAEAEFKRIAAAKADHTALTAMSKKSQAAIADLNKDMADLNASFNKFDTELSAQITQMADGLKKDRERLAAVEGKTKQLESETVNKESLELDLGLQRLSLQEMIKDKIGAVEKKVAILGQQVDTLKKRLKDQARKSSRPSPSSAVHHAPAHSPKPPAKANKIEEQTIK
jgi:chromosome segregation ATPase